MMPLLTIKGISILLWALANAVLVGTIGTELEWGHQIVPPLPNPVLHPTQSTELLLLPDHRLPPLKDNYRNTIARPLFVPTRREAPPIPPPPPPPKPTMQKGQFQLLGTLLDAEHTFAMLREVNGGKQRRVEPGGRINGILVSSIGPDKVVLSQYDDEEILAIKVMPSPKAPPTPTAPDKSAAPQAGLSGAASAKLVPAPASQRSPQVRDETSRQMRQRKPLSPNAQGAADSSPVTSAEGRPQAASPMGGEAPPK